MHDAFRRPRLLAIVVVFLAVWICLAIAPKDRADWTMENTLVFLVLGVLAVDIIASSSLIFLTS